MTRPGSVIAPREYTPDEELLTGALYRRIPNDHAHWKREENLPTKYNLTPDGQDDFLSMHLAERIRPEQIFAKHADFGLLEIKVEVLRAKGLTVIYKPEEGVDHVAVFGLKGQKNPLRRELLTMLSALWEPGTMQLLWRREVPVPRQ